jgi:hypothetical protein
MATAEQQAAEKRMAEDKKKIADENKARVEARAAHDKVFLGRPTPTQEECDLIKLGHAVELEPDGSTDPYSSKAMEAEHGGGYKTRQSSPGGGAHHQTRAAQDKA